MCFIFNFCYGVWLFLDIKDLIEKIKEFCYKYNPPSKRHHGNFKSDFIKFLIRNDCRVINEYEITYRNVKANGDIVEQRGFIDFFAKHKLIRIAIMFDNGTLLRLKSISKLLQSNSNYIIGIVRGNQRYNVLKQNMKRITYVKKRLKLLNRPILLIINSDKTARWIKKLA